MTENSLFTESELDEKYSLNGYFIKDGQHYDFFARRAFDGGWCQDTLESIIAVMKSGPFCMGYEDSGMNTDLTINWLKSRSKKWSYFNK